MKIPDNTMKIMSLGLFLTVLAMATAAQAGNKFIAETGGRIMKVDAK